MDTLVVLNDPRQWQLDIPQIEIVSAKDYLTNPQYESKKNVRVFNLCRTYRYQSLGYYVSLLASARGHRAFPSTSTITDFKSQTIIRSISEELESRFQSDLSHIKSDNFTLSIYFGQNISPKYQRLSKQLANLFQAPLLRAQFTYNQDQEWILQNISPIAINDIPADHIPYVEQFATAYFAQKRVSTRTILNPKYDLAILIDTHEKEPPSNKTAIKKFIQAAEEQDINVELITENDYQRIPEFDALFIRTTTAVNNYTYKFARRALTEGLAVIDDPSSIVKCCNKVYLAELLNRAKIPTPKTLIIDSPTMATTIIDQLGLPCVLKKPDSSSSLGVYKVSDPKELKSKLKELLEQSDLIIAQQFLPTDFDWRIGVLDRQPLYACKYFMAKDHWQIYRWSKSGKTRRAYGQSEALPLSKVPTEVIDLALKSSNLIGDSLYGVDIKQVNGKNYVIEVNDNPSIENKFEDAYLKDQLYDTIIASFSNRVSKIASQQKLSI